jgi:uncharacterized phage protein (TIGR02218 family)
VTDPIVKRGALRHKVGVEVDTLQVTLQVNPEVQQGGVPLAQFALQGGFDGARLTVQRYFAADWGVAPAGSLALFSGRVADVDSSASEVRLQVKSDLEILNTKLPRNLYMAQCLHTVYDNGCKAVRASFTVPGSAAAGSSRDLVLTALSQPEGHFDQGSLTFTSGRNAGLARTVKRQTSTQVRLAFPFPYVPEAGDSFDLVPGCDGRQATCSGKFNNLVHFRGYPYIPVPETTY